MSVEQGFDPRNFSLVAYGGAGPLHANALGKLLGAYPVIVPPSPGVLCAHGDATTLLRHEHSRTFIRRLGDVSTDDILQACGVLGDEAKSVMINEQGVSVEKQVKRGLDYLPILFRTIRVCISLSTFVMNFGMTGMKTISFQLSVPSSLMNRSFTIKSIFATLVKQ